MKNQLRIKVNKRVFQHTPSVIPLEIYRPNQMAAKMINKVTMSRMMISQNLNGFLLKAIPLITCLKIKMAS